MKTGDYIIKTKGRDKGMTGLIINIITNPVSNTIIEVLTNGNVVFWPAQLTELIKKDK